MRAKMLSMSLCLLLAAAALGQSKLEVSGTVEDSSGGALLGLKVTLLHSQTGQRWSTDSDENGTFVFRDVLPGDYTLIAEGAAFQTKRLPLHMGSASIRNLRVRMELATQREEVRVSARDSDTTSSDSNLSSVYLNSDLVTALPASGQNPLAVLGGFLSPASQGQGGASVVVDGVEGSDLDVSPESLKRIYVNRNPYSAEYRRPGSSRIELVTRNGSRGHWDGSLGVSVRNVALDARNPFATQKPDLNRRMLDATFSGPLPLPRTRFFFNGSRMNQQSSAVVSARTATGPLVDNVPTADDLTNAIFRVDSRTATVHSFTFLYSFRGESEDGRGVGGLRLREQGTTSDERRHRFQFSDTAVLSARWLNQLVITAERRFDRLGTPATQPAIQVSGAFIGGPSQQASSNRETRLVVQNTLSYSRGRHSLRFGGAFRLRKIDFADASNSVGTFVFPDLAAFSAGRPILFQGVRGNPAGVLSLNEVSGFFQDEIRVRPSLNVTLGLRYDWQGGMRDFNNLAPRIALAYAPGRGTTVFRVGAGIFYDRVQESVLERALLFDGVRLRELVIPQPSFPDPFSSSATPAPPSAWRLAPGLATPYLLQASIAVEHTLRGKLQASAEFQTFRGVHLLRARNVNAPHVLGGPVLDPGFFQIRQMESSGRMRGDALVLSLQGRVVRALKLKAQYTLSQSRNDTSGPFELPADNYDLRSEYGRAAFDARHRFTMAGMWDLPGQFRLGSVLQFSSGLPFNVTTGLDNNGDGTDNDRPFAMRRNSGRGPGFAQVDVRLSRRYRFAVTPSATEGEGESFRSVEISIDVLNLFNHANFTNVVGNLSSPLFGQPRSALTARTIQFSIRYRFRAERE